MVPPMHPAVADRPFVSAKKEQHPRLVRLECEEPGQEQDPDELHAERESEQTPYRMSVAVHPVDYGINEQSDSTEDQPDGGRQHEPAIGEGNDTFLIGWVHRLSLGRLLYRYDIIMIWHEQGLSFASERRQLGGFPTFGIRRLGRRVHQHHNHYSPGDDP